MAVVEDLESRRILALDEDHEILVGQLLECVSSSLSDVVQDSREPKRLATRVPPPGYEQVGSIVRV